MLCAPRPKPQKKPQNGSKKIKKRYPENARVKPNRSPIIAVHVKAKNESVVMMSLLCFKPGRCKRNLHSGNEHRPMRQVDAVLHKASTYILEHERVDENRKKSVMDTGSMSRFSLTLRIAG